MAYQSLEDRIVKTTFAAATASRTPAGLPVELPGYEPEFIAITRGAERADADEIERNPRSAPVRLRALQSVTPGNLRRGGRADEGRAQGSRSGGSRTASAKPKRATTTGREAGQPGASDGAAPRPPTRRRSRRLGRRPTSRAACGRARRPRPTPRPAERPARPKNTSQAKARAKARKAKAPKVVRPPLRERLIARLASHRPAPADPGGQGAVRGAGDRCARRRAGRHAVAVHRRRGALLPAGPAPGPPTRRSRSRRKPSSATCWRRRRRPRWPRPPATWA